MLKTINKNPDDEKRVRNKIEEDYGDRTVISLSQTLLFFQEVRLGLQKTSLKISGRQQKLRFEENFNKMGDYQTLSASKGLRAYF